jgi:uncharacterized membrane protein
MNARIWRLLVSIAVGAVAGVLLRTGGYIAWFEMFVIVAGVTYLLSQRRERR